MVKGFVSITGGKPRIAAGIVGAIVAVIADLFAAQ
jgi:hypothetical protein